MAQTDAGSSKLNELADLIDKPAKFHKKALEAGIPENDIEDFRDTMRQIKNTRFFKNLKKGGYKIKETVRKMSTKLGQNSLASYAIDDDTAKAARQIYFSKWHPFRKAKNYLSQTPAIQKLAGIKTSFGAKARWVGRGLKEAGAFVKSIPLKVGTKIFSVAKGAIVRVAGERGARITSRVVNHVATQTVVKATSVAGSKLSMAVGMMGGKLQVFLLVASWDSENFRWLMMEITTKAILQNMVTKLSGELTAQKFCEETVAAMLSNPATAGPGFGVKAKCALLTMASTMWTTAQIDYTILAYTSGADAAREREENLKTCISYTRTENKVLAYPPNCLPITSFKSKDLEAVDVEARDEVPAEAEIQAVSESWQGVIDAFEDVIKYLEKIANGQIWEILNLMKSLFDATKHLGETIIRVVQAGGALASKALGIQTAMAKLTENMFPQATCADDFETHRDVNRVTPVSAFFMNPKQGTGCDQITLRQDCPNYYVSYGNVDNMRMMDAIIFGSMTVSLPACSLTCPLTTVGCLGCYGAVLGSMFTYIYSVPEHMLAGLVNANMFPKEVGRKEYPVDSGMWYADNDGYYYMEFPAVIKLSKVYYPNGGSRVIISKE